MRHRKPRRSSRLRAQPFQSILRLQRLEDRCLLSIDVTVDGQFAVTNTSDSGPGSLRQAILDAEVQLGLDTIVFNIPSTDPDFVDVDASLPGGDAEPDVFAVRLLSALPELTDAVIIDGRTQAAFGGDTNPFGPEIVLNGNGLTGSHGIRVRGSDIELYGLVIQRFADGVHIENSNRVAVAGNYIGTDATGSSAFGNTVGVRIMNSFEVTVGGQSAAERNIISGNTQHGVNLTGGADNNQIVGNYIGTDRTGDVDVGNLQHGVLIGNQSFSDKATNTLISRNLVSGNDQSGINITGTASSNNWVTANRIGTTAAGTGGLGNASDGVEIAVGAQNNCVGTNGDGANDASEGNLISGNRESGVSMSGGGNVVSGNLIGTDISGSLAIGNHFSGVRAFSSNNRIGTNSDGISDGLESNLISGNWQTGILIRGPSVIGNVVAGNRIGTNATGTAALGNLEGVKIYFGAANNRVGTNGDGFNDAVEGNLVSGNSSSGVSIQGAGTTDNVVAGNLIGTNATGDLAIGNGRDGVEISDEAADNLIGTNGDGISDAAERNIISGNLHSGVAISQVFASATANNVVAGNYIGLNAGGDAALGNQSYGILLTDSAVNNRIGTNGNGMADTAEGNVISGNRLHGISLRGGALRYATGNVVAGNRLGTNAAGDVAIPNGLSGVDLFRAKNNVIGTNADGVNDEVEANLISGNATWGVSLAGLDVEGNIIAGNVIGPAADGITPIGNQRGGVSINSSPRNNVIGGLFPGSGNHIAFNTDYGVAVTFASTNQIHGNSIHDNDGLGIDLAEDGISANDSGDSDTGPNNLQNFPVLTSSLLSGIELKVEGTLHSAPNAEYTVELFANAAADPSGYGEGEVFLGAASVTTDAAGDGSFVILFIGSFADRRFITATATDAVGNTSEFSQAMETVIAPTQIIDNSAASGFATFGDWTLGTGPGVGRNDDILMAFGEPGFTDIATWTFPLSQPGRYRVAATWFTNPDFAYLFSEQARYEVLDTDFSAVRGTAVFNQQRLPDDFVDAGSAWEEMGLFDILGSKISVRLLSYGDIQTYVIADAIRIERVGDLPTAAEIQVVAGDEAGLDVADSGGHVTFGVTDFNEPLTKTFTISNTGLQPLTLTLPISVTGGAFEVISQPGAALLAPGQSTTFAVRLNAALPGSHSATISFANSDSDEGQFDFSVSGTVLSTNIIDDGDPGFFMSPAPGELAGWGQVGGPGRDFDFKFNRKYAGYDEFAIWTFDVTPGQYRVSTTWAFGYSGYDDAAPFTIFDGPVASDAVVGGRNINQQLDPDDTDYPAGFMFPLGTSSSQNWERIDVVNITGSVLTVQLLADDPLLFALADSILIDRLGDLPAGPEVVIVESNRHAAGGTVDYGQIQLTEFLDKTFTIRNTGDSTLNITSPITIGGTHHQAFTLQSGPSSTSIAPGGASTFVVRMNGAYEGTKQATIDFTTDDPDESVVSLAITGAILPHRISDDLDNGYSSIGMVHHSDIGIAYRNDFSLANTSQAQGPASATWTFNNLSPGSYYVALSWFDAGGDELWASNTQLIVRDGGAEVSNVRFSQRNGPSGDLSFPFDGAQWQVLAFFTIAGPTATFTISNDDADGLIIADGILINRTGGPIPVGNGESSDELAASAGWTDVSSGRFQLRPAENNAVDAAMLSTANWVDSVEAATETLISTSKESHASRADLQPASKQADCEPELELMDWL